MSTGASLKVAGVDAGVSALKAVWQNEKGEYVMMSSLNSGLEDIVLAMKNAGVNLVCGTGIGAEKYKNLFDCFRDCTPDNLHDKIQREIRIQAIGASSLWQSDFGSRRSEDILLVSIGTGTSFTFIGVDKSLAEVRIPDCLVRMFPIGESNGAGTIRGLGLLLGVANFEDMDEMASRGKPVDICIGDILPGTKSTQEGKFVISHFGSASSYSERADQMASLFNMVAVSTVKHIMMMNMVSGFHVPGHVVFIGSAVSKLPTFRKMLSEKCFSFAKREAVFLENGEYSGALGALLIALEEFKNDSQPSL